MATTPETAIGGAVAITVALIGWVASRWRNKTDAAGTITTAALAIVAERVAEVHDCRRELAAVTARIDVLTAALVAAGIPIPEG